MDRDEERMEIKEASIQDREEQLRGKKDQQKEVEGRQARGGQQREE